MRTVIAAFLLAISSVSSAYDGSVEILVGAVQVNGTTGGVARFSNKEMTAIPNCSSDAQYLYRPGSDSIVNNEGAKSMLSVLLAAKATGGKVRVYYSYSKAADPYCRFEVIVSL